MLIFGIHKISKLFQWVRSHSVNLKQLGEYIKFKVSIPCCKQLFSVWAGQPTWLSCLLLKPSAVHKHYLWRHMLPLQILYYNFITCNWDIWGAFSNLSTWVRKKQLTAKNYFFIFQCSPLITQYTSPTFVATILSPWKKKIFWLLFKPGRDCLLDFFIAWKSFTPKKFFITRNRK